jgi:hypothetical protein
MSGNKNLITKNYIIQNIRSMNTTTTTTTTTNNNNNNNNNNNAYLRQFYRLYFLLTILSSLANPCFKVNHENYMKW